MADRSLIRAGFDKVKRSLAQPLEGLVRTGPFMDVLAVVAKVQRNSQRQFEDASARWMRTFNLPAATDIERLERQIGAVERHLRELSDRMEADNGATPATATERTR